MEENTYETQPNSKAKIVVGAVIALLVIVAAGVGYQVFTTPEPEELPEETAEDIDLIGEKTTPEVEANESYVDAHRRLQEGDYGAARQSFSDAAAEASGLTEEVRAQFLVGNMHFKDKQYIAATRIWINILEEPRYQDAPPPLLATIVEWIGISFNNQPTDEHFAVIFEDSELLSPLKAPADAEPSQADASLDNLFRFGSENYHPTAPLELRIVNSLFNKNVPLTRRIGELCLLPERKPIESCADVKDQLSEEDQAAFEAIAAEANEHFEAALNDLQQRKINEEEMIVARTLAKLARVYWKGMYYGVATFNSTDNAMQEALAFYEKIGNVDGEIQMRTEYAGWLVTFMPQPTLEEREKIASIVEPVYTEERFEDARFFTMLQNTYNAELENHTVSQGMTVRAHSRLAEVDPGYYEFLQNEFGWDFNNPIVTRHLEYYDF